MERVVVVFMEEDASLAAAQAGQVDVAYTSATLAAQPAGRLRPAELRVGGLARHLAAHRLRRREEDRRERAQAAAGNDVTCDVAVRQAINYGVDRERMIDNVLERLRHAWPTAWATACRGPRPTWRCMTDVERAQRCSTMPAGRRAPTASARRTACARRSNLYYSAGDTVRQGIAEEFSNQMKELGLEFAIKGVSWDDLYPHQFTDPVVWGWGTNAPIETYNLFYSKGTGNYACYENAATDAYLDEALALPQGGGLVRLVDARPSGMARPASRRRATRPGCGSRTSTICTLRRRT